LEVDVQRAVGGRIGKVRHAVRAHAIDVRKAGPVLRRGVATVPRGG
jgi:hypothetical protein